MTLTKRAFDILLALGLGLVLSPFFLVIALLILIFEGRPVFYISERMKGLSKPFALVKFRTMTVDQGADSGVSGGDKSARVTRLGHFLRASRLDETPQLWNVLKGDMSFVGPRPPLRQYVDRYPDIYAEVLRSRPGITGLASLYFHKHEERLLAACTSREETDSVYSLRCIPRKARLDLIYQRNQTLCLDINVMVKTVLSKMS